MSRQTRATLFGLGAVLLWSTVATAFKLTLRHTAPAPLLLWASVFSTIALASILAVQGRLGLMVSGGRAAWRRAAGLGLLNPFLYYLVLFEAYDRLPAQEAQPLNYTWALPLAMLSILILRQRITRRDILAGVVCYCGVWIISTHGDVFSVRFSDALGVGLALGSTVIWALYWVWNTGDRGDPVAALLRNFLCGLPAVALWCAATGQLGWPTHPALIGCVYVGFFEMGFTFALWLAALRRAENTALVGNLIFLSPFVSLIFINRFLGETILPSTFVGLALIVGGLVLQRTGRKA